MSNDAFFMQNYKTAMLREVLRCLAIFVALCVVVFISYGSFSETETDNIKLVISSNRIDEPAGGLQSNSTDNEGYYPEIIECNEAEAVRFEPAECPDCIRERINQDAGNVTAAISNMKDKAAQTFKVPEGYGEISLYGIGIKAFSFKGSGLCLSVWELVNNEIGSQLVEPMHGKQIYLGRIPVNNLLEKKMNVFYFNNLKIQKGKTYSFVISVSDNQTQFGYYRGDYISTYKDGSAYYFKDYLAPNCEKTLCTSSSKWISYNDDLTFSLYFYK